MRAKLLRESHARSWSRPMPEALHGLAPFPLNTNQTHSGLMLATTVNDGGTLFCTQPPRGLAAPMQNPTAVHTGQSARRSAVLHQMGVAPRRVDIAVSGQLADHRNTFANRPDTGHKAVPASRSRTRWDSGPLPTRTVVILVGTEHLGPQLSDATSNRLRIWETS